MQSEVRRRWRFSSASPNNCIRLWIVIVHCANINGIQAQKGYDDMCACWISLYLWLRNAKCIEKLYQIQVAAEKKVLRRSGKIGTSAPDTYQRNGIKTHSVTYTHQRSPFPAHTAPLLLVERRLLINFILSLGFAQCYSICLVLFVFHVSFRSLVSVIGKCFARNNIYLVMKPMRPSSLLSVGHSQFLNYCRHLVLLILPSVCENCNDEDVLCCTSGKTANPWFEQLPKCKYTKFNPTWTGRLRHTFAIFFPVSCWAQEAQRMSLDFIRIESVSLPKWFHMESDVSNQLFGRRRTFQLSI